MEIAKHHYRCVTFTFGSFPWIQVFSDHTTEPVLGRIRAFAFTAHLLLQNPKACQRFTNGQHLQTEEVNIALFKRFPNLETLEISFYPSISLAVATRLSEAIKPLEQLAVSNITVSIPNMVYSTTGDIGLSLMSRPGDDRKLTLRSPDLSAREAQMSCRAYFASSHEGLQTGQDCQLLIRHNMISISRSLFRDSPHFHGPPGTRQR
ncbi:hypothetical protein DL765_009274 [Monosporascus sp. GIB2]|nr:hypothetical protein DL765_009274 [Monosporascus sp. GIB2]